MFDVLVPAITTDRATGYVGDTVAVLPLLDAPSVDSVVTDPPYGLEFCDQDWDGLSGYFSNLHVEIGPLDRVSGRAEIVDLKGTVAPNCGQVQTFVSPVERDEVLAHHAAGEGVKTLAAEH